MCSRQSQPVSRPRLEFGAHHPRQDDVLGAIQGTLDAAPWLADIPESFEQIDQLWPASLWFCDELRTPDRTFSYKRPFIHSSAAVILQVGALVIS